MNATTFRNYLSFKPAFERIGFLTLYSTLNFNSKFVMALSYPPKIMAQKKEMAKVEETYDELGILVYTLMKNEGMMQRQDLIKAMQEKRILSNKQPAAEQGLDRLIGDFRELMHYDENFPVLLTRLGKGERQSTLILDGYAEETVRVKDYHYGRQTGRILVASEYGKMKGHLKKETYRQTRYSLTQIELECLDFVMDSSRRYTDEKKLFSLPSVAILKNDRRKAVSDALRRALIKMDALDFIRYENKRYFIST